MAETDGLLKAQYEVHCRVCEQPVLGLGPDRQRAARELTKEYGWKCIKGRWHCATCARQALHGDRS